MNSEFSRDNVMNSFIAPNSAWNILRIEYVCEPNFYDVVIVFFPHLPFFKIKIKSQLFGDTIGVLSQAKKKCVGSTYSLGTERQSYSKPLGFAYQAQLSSTFP